MSSVLSQHELLEWLRTRIEERTPTAVVRFGDGEEVLMGARADEAGSIAAAKQKLARHADQHFSAEAVLEIKRAIEQAFDEADALGILYGHELVEGQMNRLTRIYADRVRCGRKPAVLAHCLLSHDILDSLPGMLAGRRVSVISCRDVKPVLEAEWGVQDVPVYKVPSQHAQRDLDGAYEAALHDVPIWPDVHTRIREELTVRERGEVFLIGAGVFGKDLCIRVRDDGGVAVDLGSALDRVVGKITRGPRRLVASLHARGMSAAEIAIQLEGRFGVKIDREEVSALTSDAPAPVGGDPPTLDMLDFYAGGLSAFRGQWETA
ncbi:MAG: hypothetical protein ABW196_09560 [Solirubrobacterales bacterium]